MTKFEESGGYFEVGPGWMDICRAAVERVEAAGAEVVQVKEKFGGLRIYWSSPDPEDAGIYERIQPIVREAEIVAAWTCMECGKVKGDVKVRSSLTGWLVGYCGECLRAWNEELVREGRADGPEEEGKCPK